MCLEVPSSIATVVEFAHRIPSATGHGWAWHYRRAQRCILELALLPAALPQKGPDGDNGELSKQEDGSSNDKTCCNGRHE